MAVHRGGIFRTILDRRHRSAMSLESRLSWRLSPYWPISRRDMKRNNDVLRIFRHLRAKNSDRLGLMVPTNRISIGLCFHSCECGRVRSLNAMPRTTPLSGITWRGLVARTSSSAPSGRKCAFTHQRFAVIGWFANLNRKQADFQEGRAVLTKTTSYAVAPCL